MADGRPAQIGRSRFARSVETLRRHRLRFTLPVIVSVVFSAWFALGAAPAYRSTATLWVDNGPAEGSSLSTLAGDAAAASNGYYAALQGPADFEQSVLKELLQTPTFDLAVGKGSLLPRYLASGARSGFSPAVLLARRQGSPQDQAAASVATQVTAAALGPQVLSLSYTGPTPEVARSVLASVITQMQGSAPQYGTDFARQEQEFFQQAQSSAARAAANAQASLSDYTRSHGYANAQTDTTYAALVKTVNRTKSTLATATAAVQSTQGTGPGMKATLRIIDPASLASGPVVSPGRTALGLLGGLFVGVMLGVLAIYLATPDRRRWDAELSNAAWMSVTLGAQRRPQRARTRHTIGTDRGVA